jgi:hypothetical protein
LPTLDEVATVDDDRGHRGDAGTLPEGLGFAQLLRLKIALQHLGRARCVKPSPWPRIHPAPQAPIPREDFARQPLCADMDGFSLRAAVRIDARDRKRLDQLFLCITPPL